MRIQRIRGLALICSFAVLTALAQAQSPTPSLDIPFKQFRLDNGLRVVLSQDQSAPVVAIAVYYDVGSRNEVKGRSGFAHLFEHMMFQGSENVPKAGHFQYVENSGGVLNGSTHVDYTNYYQLMPSNQLELALWLESDRMRSLKITPANLENQQEAVKEEKRLSIDNQAYWPALLKMEEMLFKNWANAHSTIGSMEDLDAATITDVREFFETYYKPNNAVLAIAGDIDLAAAESLVRKYFGSIPKGRAPPAVDVSEPPDVAEAKVEVEDQHAQMPALAIGWKIPERRSPDFYPLALLNSILFDGQSARLYQKLVKETAVSLEVQGFLDSRRGPGSLAFYTIHKQEVEPGKVQQIVEEEVGRLKETGPSPEELTKVKNQYRLSRVLGGSGGSEYESLQTALGRALALAEFALFDNDPSLINTEMNRYLAVTANEIRDAARKHLGTRNRSVMYIRPSAKQTDSSADASNETVNGDH